MENYKIPFAVRLLDRILPLFLEKDVDYQTIRKILILKLTLDGRRTTALTKAQSKSGKSDQKNMMIFNYIMFAFMGLMTSFLQISNNAFFINTLSYGVLIFILLSMYISEYSEILLDTKEKPFYRVLPIREKELSIAKNIHISIYIGGMAFATVAPSVMMSLIFRGPLYSLLYLVMAVLVTLFCLWLAGAMYYFLLKLFSGEKLKDILNYFQVFMTVAIVLSYQIIPRLINLNEIDTLTLGINPALLFLPSAWYAAIFGIVFQGQGNWFYFLLLAVGILAIVGFSLLNRFFIMPQFEKQLSKLEDVSKENKTLSKYKRIFCKLFSKKEQDRAFMELVMIHVSRDRNLKLKLYPQLANAFILPVIIFLPFIFSGGRGDLSFDQIITIMQNSPLYLSLYFMALVTPGVYYIICQSDTAATTWIYETLPWRNRNDLIKAGIKVVLGHFMNPIFFVLSLVLLIFYKGQIALDILFIFGVYLLYSNIMIRLSAWHLPFSISGQIKVPARQYFYFFAGLIMVIAVGAMHYFILKTALAKGIGIVIVTILNILWWKYGMNKKM